jgi:hypothetical protein
MSSLIVAAQSLEKAAQAAARAVERCEAKLCKLREALAAAEEQLSAAEAEAARVQHTIQAVLDAAAQYKPAAKSKAKPISAPTMRAAAQVTTDRGEVRPLSREVARKVREVIGRRKSGLLEPLDGEDAQAVLTALDEGGNVGDVFTVAIGHRRVRFEVRQEGLFFQTVGK